jgi:hypothetical protein
MPIIATRDVGELLTPWTSSTSWFDEMMTGPDIEPKLSLMSAMDPGGGRGPTAERGLFTNALPEL